MGDTPAHNKIAGLKNGSATTNPPCRLCKLCFEDLSNPYAEIIPTGCSDFVEITENNHDAYPKSHKTGYHMLKNNVFRRLKFCDWKLGLNGAL